MDTLVHMVAVFFFLMGVLGLVDPGRIAAMVGYGELNRAGANEARAVYGGFGLAVAALLWLSLSHPDLRPGVHATVALSLLGMAAGRLFSFIADREAGRFARLIFMVELSLGGAMAYVFYAG